MGRWGHRMFEGDVDIDLACEIGKGTKAGHLSRMIYQTDMLAPQEAKAFHQTEQYKAILEKEVDQQRKILDTGVCDEPFKQFRTDEEKNKWDGEYRIIVLAALMMRAGAKIKEQDLDLVRDILPKISSRNGYQLPICDDGFRAPGKVQFEAALKYYKPGVARNFCPGPSCFNCGKIQADLNDGNLMRCKKCKTAYYCDKECQKTNWKTHKVICFKDGIRPGTFMSLNV